MTTTGCLQWYSGQEYFCYIEVPNCHKLLTNFYHILLYRKYIAMSGIRTDNFGVDMHWLHMLLWLKLPYYHEHDSQCKNGRKW